MSSPSDLHDPRSEGSGPGQRGPGGEGNGKIPIPNNVVIAFWAWVVSVVLSLVELALHMPRQQDMLAAAKQMDTSGLSEQQLEQVANIAVVASIVVSVVFALLYLLFAWKMRAGKNWARVTLTLLTLFQVVMALGTGAGGWIALAICCLAVVAMYLPSSQAYFVAVAARKSGRGAPRR